MNYILSTYTTLNHVIQECQSTILHVVTKLPDSDYINYLEPHIPVKKSLSKLKMIILTLMRRRLNLTTSFLSYEFNVSVATVSRVFSDVIDIMYIRMKPLDVWPSRGKLRKTMPMQFRKYFGTKCAVIIDC